MTEPDLGPAVEALVRKTAATAVMPVYQRLDESDVTEKSPGQVVTVADRRAEEMLTEGLTALLPGSVVVGEEGVAADPALIDNLSGTGAVWIVDPVDGTANFAAGRGPFALMVALVEGGEPTAAWVYEPLEDVLSYAAAGQGAYVNGTRVDPRRAVPPPGELRGVAPSRYFPQDLRRTVDAGTKQVGEVLRGHHCAGREYRDMLTGAQQFTVFWRTMPWDHAPGAVLVREAGGVIRRFDGSEYRPAPDPGAGLLAAANDETWHFVATTLLPTSP